jgi:hypothetical protein
VRLLNYVPSRLPCALNDLKESSRCRKFFRELLSTLFITRVYVANKLILFRIVDTAVEGIKFKAWESKAANNKVLPSKYFNAIY